MRGRLGPSEAAARRKPAKSRPSAGEAPQRVFTLSPASQSTGAAKRVNEKLAPSMSSSSATICASRSLRLGAAFTTAARYAPLHAIGLRASVSTTSAMAAARLARVASQADT